VLMSEVELVWCGASVLLCVCGVVLVCHCASVLLCFWGGSGVLDTLASALHSGCNLVLRHRGRF
jgi:hypothetical protein